MRERRPRLRRRDERGMALMALLVVWVLVGGVSMVALLNMTATSSRIAAAQTEASQRARAVDAALTAAVNLIEQDPDGRVRGALGRNVENCLGRVGSADHDGLAHRDGFGTRVQVTSTCRRSGASLHEVRLVAFVDGDRIPAGSAELVVAERLGGGSVVSVRHWSVRGAGPDVPVTLPPGTHPPLDTLPSTTSTAPTTTIGSGDVSWTSTVTNDWGTGYCVDITVLNGTRDTVEWKVQVPFEGRIYDFWNGTRVDSTDRHITVVGVDWNRELAPGRTAVFGFCSNRPTPTTVPPTSSAGDVSWTSTVTNDWGTGYCVDITVLNETDQTVEWKIQVPVEGTIYTFWNATKVDSGDNWMTVVGVDWNRELAPGRSAVFGFCANRARQLESAR